MITNKIIITKLNWRGTEIEIHNDFKDYVKILIPEHLKKRETQEALGKYLEDEGFLDAYEDREIGMVFDLDDKF